MFNLLIVSNNFKNVKRISNNLINKLDFIRLIGIVSNIDELVTFILKDKPDIILLSNSIYSKLIKLDILKYKPMFIILSNLQNCDYKKFSNRLYISNSICDNKFQTITESFIINKDSETLKKSISDILIDVKFNFSLYGSKYLLDAIIYSYTNKDLYVFENLESNVYPYIAKKHHTTVSNVKWSIVRSINSMYFSHTTYSMKKISKYFNLDLLKKPTSKIIICTIVSNLEKEHNDKRKCMMK